MAVEQARGDPGDRANGSRSSKSIPEPPRSLLEFLDAYDTYYLVGHIEPDGDCLASSLALGSFLERRGKKVRHFNQGPFYRTEVKQFEQHFSGSLDPREVEDETSLGAVILDCSTKERVGDLGDALDKLPSAVIDHHSAGQPFGDVTYIIPTSPSTSLLIQTIIEAFDEVPSATEAEHILFALSTDTGFFRHLDTGSQDAFFAAGRLVEAGASPKRVFDMIYGGKTLSSRQLMARVLSRTETLHGGKYMLSYETAADTAEFGRENRDSDTLYQLLMGTRGCEVVAVLREESRHSCTGSLRSSNDVDVGEIAKRFGGGGHKRAAGFLAEKPWTTVMQELREVFDNLESGSP